MQSIGYGIIMPVYCGVHLLLSPTALGDPSQLQKSVRPRDDLALSTLPWSILWGYILPATMMSLPWFSPKVHQYLVAVWQVFPVWIVALQYLFSKTSRFFLSPQQRTPKTTEICAINFKCLNQVYHFAFTLATLTHFITLGLIAWAQWFPTMISKSDGYAVTFQEVFLPSNFRTRARISDMVQGAHNFFQYDQYVGSMAAIIWAMTLRCNIRNEVMSTRQWAQLAFEIFGYIMVAGPTGALVMVLWTRDIQVTEARVHMHEMRKASSRP